MSDSDDDNHSDSELDDMMYLMSGTIKNDDDDDVEEVNIGEWIMVRDYRTIVEVDGTNTCWQLQEKRCPLSLRWQSAASTHPLSSAFPGGVVGYCYVKK